MPRTAASSYKARTPPPLLLLLALMGCLALACGSAAAADSTNTHRKLLQAQGSPAPAQACEYRGVADMMCVACMFGIT